MDDNPLKPTEEHSKFALQALLSNLSEQQQADLEKLGWFAVNLRGTLYTVTHLGQSKRPLYDMVTIEFEVKHLFNNPRISEGFKAAVRETISRWKAERDQLASLDQIPRQWKAITASITIPAAQAAKLAANIKTPHPFSQRKKP